MARSGERNALTPSAAIRSASMSRPESISSRMQRLGSNSAICRISLRFFSPPENPKLTPPRSLSLGKVRLGPDSPNFLEKVRRGKFALAARLALRIQRGAQERHGRDTRNLHRILEREEHAVGGALVGRHLQQVLAIEQDLAA